MMRPTRLLAVLGSILLSTLTAQASRAEVPANACALVTASELQSAIGGAITLQSGSMGKVQTCSGQTQAGTRVLVRMFTRTTDAAGNTEKAGIAAAKKSGAQTEVQNNGGVMCSTVVPPQGMEAMGYGTTCTVTRKAPLYLSLIHI